MSLQVFYYSVPVFEQSGIPPSRTQYAVLGTGVINVLMTGISVSNYFHTTNQVFTAYIFSRKNWKTCLAV